MNVTLPALSCAIPDAWIDQSMALFLMPPPPPDPRSLHNKQPVSPGNITLTWTRTSDANYRLSGRADVLVKGSIAEATAAFDECARGRHRSLIVAACGLTAVSVSFALRLSVFL